MLYNLNIAIEKGKRFIKAKFRVYCYMGVEELLSKEDEMFSNFLKKIVELLKRG